MGSIVPIYYDEENVSERDIHSVGIKLDESNMENKLLCNHKRAKRLYKPIKNLQYEALCAK